MWSSIVGKKNIIVADNKKIITNKKFDEPFNIEFISSMINFVKLPKDLTNIVEQYLQPIFNQYRYKVPKSIPYSSHRSLNLSRTYEGYNFYKRFNIDNIHNKNHYRFKININKQNCTKTGDYYDINVELFPKGDDWFCYKYSLIFPVKDLDYLYHFSYEKENHVELFMNYFLNFKNMGWYHLSFYYHENFHMITGFKFYETLVVWSKVLKYICLHFHSVK